MALSFFSAALLTEGQATTCSLPTAKGEGEAKALTPFCLTCRPFALHAVQGRSGALK